MSSIKTKEFLMHKPVISNMEFSRKQIQENRIDSAARLRDNHTNGIQIPYHPSYKHMRASAVITRAVGGRRNASAYVKFFFYVFYRSILSNFCQENKLFFLQKSKNTIVLSALFLHLVWQLWHVSYNL